MTTHATAHIVAKIRYLRDGERMGHIDNSLADSELVRMMAAEATYKLDDATKKGRHGWWDNQVCTVTDLKASLANALIDGKMIDVINYAAMIHARIAVDGDDITSLMCMLQVDQPGGRLPQGGTPPLAAANAPTQPATPPTNPPSAASSPDAQGDI